MSVGATSVHCEYCAIDRTDLTMPVKVFSLASHVQRDLASREATSTRNQFASDEIQLTVIMKILSA
jgi:hypothetical protein